MEKEITVIEAYDLAQSGSKIQLIDIRSEEEYQAAHVEGFENIPMSELSHEMPNLDGKRKILLLCADGKQSAQAQTMLEACGYQPLVIRGGLQDWQQVIGLD